MNPARSIGPAMVSGHLRDLWLSLVAPTAGAVAGAATYLVFRGRVAVSSPGVG